MRAIVKDGEVRGLKDGTWRVRGSEMWMLVAGDLSRIIHFPAIIQSIISPEQTMGSSKLKVTLWWAPPSRVWCMCACVCEMDWRALRRTCCSALVAASHTRSHTLTCCWAELKSAHGHIKTVIRAQGRGKRIRWGFFSTRSHLPEQGTASRQSEQTGQQSHQVLCVHVCMCVNDPHDSWVYLLVTCNFGYLGI